MPGDGSWAKKEQEKLGVMGELVHRVGDRATPCSLSTPYARTHGPIMPTRKQAGPDAALDTPRQPPRAGAALEALSWS